MSEPQRPGPAAPLTGGAVADDRTDLGADLPTLPPAVVQDILFRLNREVVDALHGAKQIKHPGESGRARENVVAKALAQFVPEAFGISTGFVIDAVGGMSRQQDIVVFRRGYHPVFNVGGIEHFMVESVAAVIQNRATVTSRRSLLDALETVASVKDLDRMNHGTNYVIQGSARGENVNTDHYHHQVWGAIVTEASLAPATLGPAMTRFLASNNPRRWPNLFVDVNGPLGAFQRADGGITDVPADGVRWLLTTPTEEQGESVPPFVDLLGHLANFLRVTPLVDYSPASYFPSYVGPATNWNIPGGRVALASI